VTKILWHSVAPWVGSGYGSQTATFAPRIKALGHDLAISAYYGLMGAKLNWRGITCYPAYAKSYGGDVIVPHAVDHFGGGPGKSFRTVADQGLIITLGDVWTFNAPLLAEMNVAAWVPVDHEHVPPAVVDWFQTMGAIPIAMSRFGERALTEVGFKPLYVPHGIDTSVFCPGDKAEARGRVGLPADAFVVAMVAANVGKDGARKAFYEQILAFGELHRKHPDAVLAIHTDVTSPYGVDIRHLLSDFPESSYWFTDQYAYKVGVPASTIADIYRAADVLTNCSWGEGFGVPIVEAEACGTPVIVTDTTAMPELVGAGWKVPGEPMWHDSQSAWARRPFIASIVAAYEEAYDRARDEQMRAQAWAFAQEYDADRVLAEHWEPALKHLADALARRGDDAARAPGRPQVRVRQADGLLWVDRGTGSEDYLGLAEHEAELAPIVDGLLSAGGVVLDVGAHVGHWALRLAGKAAQVFAVEPNPDAASGLRRNVAVNDLGNVSVLEFAAWDEVAWLRLDDPHAHTGGGSTRTVPGKPDTAGVAGMRLDTSPQLRHLDRLDLVKLDVEGADLHALRGMAGLLSRHHPVLFVECHDYCGYYTRAELEETLSRLGYQWEVAFSYQTHWSPEGPRAEPAKADYLICRPVEPAPVDAAVVAKAARHEHHASQREDELAVALAEAARVRPQTIVEIGCDAGGTLFAWRQLCDAVYGITLADNSYAAGGSARPLACHGAQVHIGDSHDPAALEWLRDQLDGDPVDVLVLDGDHSAEGVRADLANFGPLVRSGGLILMHDIDSRTDPRAQVHQVWPELAERHITSTVRPPTGDGYGWGIIHVGEPWT
jgi:FkbM family methyltransferase